MLMVCRMMEHSAGMMHDVTGMVDQFTRLMDQDTGIVGNFVDGTHMYGIWTCEFSVVVAILAFSLTGRLLQLAVPLQLGKQEDAHQRRSKAAVVQAEAAVEIRHRGHQQEVQEGRNDALLPAVFVGNGAQAVGIAQAHNNGL